MDKLAVPARRFYRRPFPNIRHDELRELALLGESLKCNYLTSQTNRNIRKIFINMKDMTFPRVITSRPRRRSMLARWRI